MITGYKQIVSDDSDTVEVDCDNDLESSLEGAGLRSAVSRIKSALSRNRPESAHHSKQRPDSNKANYQLKPIVYTNLEGQVDYFVDKMLLILSKVIVQELLQTADEMCSDTLINLRIRQTRNAPLRTSASLQRDTIKD